MGACATKPKVDGGKAPVTEENAVGDGGEKDIVMATTTRESTVVVGEEEAVSRKQSLSNLLYEAEEENNKAKGDDKQAEFIEQKLKSESINLENTLEKFAQLTELPKQEQLAGLEKHVPTEAGGTFDGCKSELAEAEIAKLPVPQVVTSEALNLPEAVTKVVAVAPEILPIETPKPSEGTNSTDAAAVVPKSETPRLSEVTKTGEVAPVVPKPEIMMSSDVTKNDKAVTAAASKLETPKPSEVTKTEEVTPVAPKSATLEPTDATKAVDAKKDDSAIPTSSETKTPKPSPTASESTRS